MDLGGISEYWLYLNAVGWLYMWWSLPIGYRVQRLLFIFVYFTDKILRSHEEELLIYRTYLYR